MEKMKEAEKQKDILDCSIESSAQRLKVNKGDDELEIKKVVSKQIESNDILNLDEKEFE